MNEIILSSGRSHSKTMVEIMQSEEYKKSILAAGISAEDMRYFAAKISAAFADTTEATEQLTKVSELIRSAAQDLNKSLLKVRDSNANHVNPFYRKYQTNGYIRKGSFR
ncbi:hypothetical protein EGY05_08140 [Chryseobacterium arthrosphaerae]|uniref:hypothetical protein n=1 Tax=Chryseobacterium TaxID=59732 RepID=UPI000F4DB9CF|nr:hypothetical protein [Chryseobacterium arthrosphaerae]AYZ11895.1 hypothetical protein EGY05_08140 [Chryseobacterium arthrosphaerae]